MTVDVLVNDPGISGAREAVRLALLGRDDPTGTFSNSAGPLPW